MSEPAQPVLVFNGVTLPEQAPYDGGLSGVRFALQAGELLLVEVPSETARTPLADLACGVVEPESGSVLYRGRDWRDRSADEAAAERGRIGRVFETGGWISNLDLDENITLATRYHEFRPAAEALAEAEALARALGQAELLRARPALISRNELRRSQWVRALLGQPVLLLLERPDNDLPAAWRAPLLEQIRLARTRGTTVVWITSDLPEADRARLKPTLHLQMRDTKLQPVS